MQIKWPNVFAMALIITALLVALRFRQELGTTLSTITDIGPGHTPEQMTIGLLVLGLLGTTIVATVRILTRDRAP